MANIRCPKCGSRTTIRTAKKDDCQYHVCVNYPRCRGRVLADEDQGGDWGDDWGKERLASRAVYDKPRRRREPEHPERRAVTAVRKSREDKREVAARVDRPARKSRVSPDVSWGDDWNDDRGGNWGDDWDEEIPEAKTARVGPRSPVAPKIVDDKPRPQRVPKAAHDEPRPRRVPKAAHDEPQERKEPKVTHDKPRHPRAPEDDVVPKEKKPSRPLHQKVTKEKAVSKEKEPAVPRWRIWAKKKAVPEEKELFKPQRLEESQEDVASKKKKRNLIVMIVALVVAFLAIDGMIYAAVVLR